MGEGVDPTQMCQRLVDKVGRSKQLFAMADPNLLVLFEDWLEDTGRGDCHHLVKEQGSADPGRCPKRLGLSPAGAAFLLTKLKQEGRLA